MLLARLAVWDDKQFVQSQFPAEVLPVRTDTYIDSQTLGGAAVALEGGDPSSWSKWNTESLLTSTCVLIGAPDLKISPSARLQQSSIGPFDGTSGIHGIMGTQLASAIKPYLPNTMITAESSRNVRKWAMKNYSRIAMSLNDLMASSDYQAWIDYESRKGWLTATKIINGIVDQTFLGPIAKVVGINEREAMAVLESSRDPATLSGWLSASYRGEDKEIAKKMFSVGALLRGRFHDNVAERVGTSIIHHPIRECVLKSISNNGSVTFSSSNSLEYLGRIIIGSSLVGNSAEERVESWCLNVKRVREGLLFSHSASVPADDVADDLALKMAVRAAQDCGIKTTSKRIDQVIHHVIGLGAGAATSLLLHPWMFPAGYAATELALSTLKEGIVPSLWASSNARLSRLAKCTPGRLVYNRRSAL